MTQALVGGLAHTHTQNGLYWAGYGETAICQPRFLARMKHGELSWLIIVFNSALWGIKRIRSPPRYWHTRNWWQGCAQLPDSSKTRRSINILSRCFLRCGAWRLCCFWTQLLASSEWNDHKQQVTDLMGSVVALLLSHFSCHGTQTLRAGQAQACAQLMHTIRCELSKKLSIILAIMLSLYLLQ